MALESGSRLVMVLQQRAEHRIVAEPGQAGPDDAATGVDKRPETAVADQREVE